MDMIELKRKVNFVKEIEKVVVGACHGIEGVRYEVYARDDNQWVREWIVIQFKGGAILTRNSNGNSLTAILREIGNYIDGGYYDEVQAYEAMANNSLWKRINFEKEED